MGIRDSEIVKDTWRNKKNYLIQVDSNIKSNKCAIYFSSNALYYPDTEDEFRKRILEGDAYEWYGKRVKDAGKHIFVRDVFKCWYVKGINQECSDIFKLSDWLKKEADGYEVVVIGSSAGAYAAMVCGSLLNCKVVYAFNPQIKIDGLSSHYPLLNNLYGRLSENS